MSVPSVTSISPSNLATDVILGTPVTVTFDQAIDQRSVTSATFVLFGPGVSTVIANSQLVQGQAPTAGREFVSGLFHWPLPNQVVFTAGRSLRANVKYTLVLAGGGGAAAVNSIKNLTGEPLAASLQISFQTGSIDRTSAPPSAPLSWNDPATQPWMRPSLNPAEISVRPVKVEGNDLTQLIVLTFPGPIDPASFQLSDILLSVEALANDPLLPVPSGLQYTAQVVGNQITVLVGNWPVNTLPVLPPPPPASLYFETPSGPQYGGTPSSGITFGLDGLIYINGIPIGEFNVNENP